MGAAAIAATTFVFSLVDPCAQLGAWSGAMLPDLVATSAKAAGEGDAAVDVLSVDSVATEPAVPLNLSLKIRVLPTERLIEIEVTVAKRTGYPTEMFSTTGMTAEVALPPGLQLEDGSLSWSGDLIGDDVAEFVATVKAVHDTEGVITAAATGEGPGGSVNADREEVHVSVQNGKIQVALQQSPVTGGPVAPASATPVQ